MERGFRIEIAAAEPKGCDRLVAFTFEDRAFHFPAGTHARFTELARTRGSRGVAGERLETSDPLGEGRVLELRGLGPSPALKLETLCAAVTRAARDGAAAGSTRLGVLLPDTELLRQPAHAERMLRELALASYRFDRFRTSADPEARSPMRIDVVPPTGDLRPWRTALRRAAIVGRATRAARDLANTPPNEATPDWMASRVRDLGRRIGAKVTVLGERELARRGMGGILAVGRGSSNPPRMVRLEWGRGPQTIALVGKGVTFDSGGLSIKPAAAMDEMKWDKCGACAVFGALQAAAELSLPLRLRAYLPFAENMLGGAAYRPGDIVTCGNGKTVEILNTDAEGRMILADAMAWAASDRADAIVELSTLTGACVVALGQNIAGLFTPDDPLAEELTAAANATGERIWRLPLGAEFLEEMRGAHADLRNSGGRWGGASNAAAFLSQFVEPVSRWAHLDIAGPAYVGGEDRVRRGATGFGVALVVEWLSRIAEGTARRRPARA